MAISSAHGEVGTIDNPGGAIVAPEVGAGSDVNHIARGGTVKGEPWIMKGLVQGTIAGLGASGDEPVCFSVGHIGSHSHLVFGVFCSVEQQLHAVDKGRSEV